MFAKNVQLNVFFTFFQKKKEKAILFLAVTVSYRNALGMKYWHYCLSFFLSNVINFFRFNIFVQTFDILVIATDVMAHSGF